MIIALVRVHLIIAEQMSGKSLQSAGRSSVAILSQVKVFMVALATLIKQCGGGLGKSGSTVPLSQPVITTACDYLTQIIPHCLLLLRGFFELFLFIYCAINAFESYVSERNSVAAF